MTENLRIATTADLASVTQNMGIFGAPAQPPPETVYAQDNVTTTTFTISQLNNQIANLQSQVTNLNAQITALQAQIAAAQAVPIVATPPTGG